jgi:predicted nuclease of restriction endonuclease-like (RecB) superfamily
VNQFENETNLISSQPVNQIDEKFVMQEVTKIPWGHIKVIITKLKDKNIAAFYILKTRENNWSRDVLALQIKSNLFERTGGSVSNFKNTLPDPYSDLAQQTLKDPYVFDFLTLSEGFKERDIEQQLVSNIRKFLLELGKGFAFVGQQYNIQIAENDYFLDLLFYHIKLKCYVVIELKNTSFIPEYAGKLNFYLSAVDSLLKEDDDKPEYEKQPFQDEVEIPESYLTHHTIHDTIHDAIQVEPEIIERIVEVPFEVIREVERIVEVPVEVIREVPVEVIREVPVDRIIEIIREIPVETTIEVPFKYYINDLGQVFDEEGIEMENLLFNKKIEEIERKILKYKK